MVGMLILGTATLSMAGSLTWRETRQQARICQGMGNGQVTPWKFRHLDRQQGRIGAHRDHAWSDGCLNRREGRHLTRMQKCRIAPVVASGAQSIIDFTNNSPSLPPHWGGACGHIPANYSDGHDSFI